MKRWFALLIWKKIIILSQFPQQRQKTLSSLPEVGNVTSKCDGITCYCSSHVLGEITIKSYNVSYKPRAITLWSNYDLNKPSTFYGLLKHYAITQRCNVVLSQYCCNGHIDGLFLHIQVHIYFILETPTCLQVQLVYEKGGGRVSHSSKWDLYDV
jgi:hypothetical protein